MSQAFPATVSAFRLDKYEVTVGRFRQFVAAVVAGWTPDLGAGKHTHLNAGMGLANGDPAAGYEAGWDTAWNGQLAASWSEWTTNLECPAGQQPTWTPSAGNNENLPVVCLDWFEAYAFCIWDGGFLPSEAEWNYAAAGGSEQRVYPWSVPSSSTLIDCSHANYTGTNPCVAPPAGYANAVGSESTKGDGKWGHVDLAGNVWEWALDFYLDYAPACTDCANLDRSSFRVIRGGAFDYHEPNLLTSFRYDFDP
jgi:formylglycine-generating enzyme required for sulfatase activity